MRLQRVSASLRMGLLHEAGGGAALGCAARRWGYGGVRARGRPRKPRHKCTLARIREHCNSVLGWRGGTSGGVFGRARVRRKPRPGVGLDRGPHLPRRRRARARRRCVEHAALHLPRSPLFAQARARVRGLALRQQRRQRHRLFRVAAPLDRGEEHNPGRDARHLNRARGRRHRPSLPRALLRPLKRLPSVRLTTAIDACACERDV
mmetsp:Transcript_288/g.903  ORF Transcript_288/g.903 Transcript_288/m.903 type:complete len:206 (-) Transcript_288:21-638(-)